MLCRLENGFDQDDSRIDPPEEDTTWQLATVCDEIVMREEG